MKNNVGKTLKTRKAFSLIELMVVVAIIGLLATIALPNYQKYQGRSRQTLAKSWLSAIFTAERSFQGEYGIYHYDLAALGFTPEGIDTSVVGCPPIVGSKLYYGTWDEHGAAPWPPALSTMGLSDSKCTNAVRYYTSTPGLCKYIDAIGPLTDGNLGAPSSSVHLSSFAIHVIGCPAGPGSDTSLQLDRWSINENRVLSNMNSGL